MLTAQELIALIESRMTELRAALTPARRKAFEERYYELTDALTGGDDAAKIAQDLLALVQKHPPVAKLLQLDEPAPLPETVPTQAPAEEGLPPPLASPVKPEPAPQVQAPSQQGFKPMTEIPQITPRKGISVDTFITIFKEVVTAIIALLLVWTTVGVITSLLGYVGDELRIAHAKDLLSVLTGLMGVVLGYYFGRIPAEARAAQAQEQATQAVAAGEQAKARSDVISMRAEELADQAGELAASLQGAPQARGQANTSEVLRRWTADVDELRRMARSR